ncbi:15026_t:CDS:10 [Dentiscutata erythropus]|uniref:15026_t:CDS:1 n=1 Tax=Dentiscutata erythropus TaxID=1348616 RepID=A0A9N8VJG5_9GLOM|nr:15026_t:CDS:10 [Dentiscutata erythropus]
MSKETVVDVEEESEIKDKYLVFSPDGDFVVKFGKNFTKQLPAKDEDNYFDIQYSNSLSYYKHSYIHTSQTLEFTKEQLKLTTGISHHDMTLENIEESTYKDLYNGDPSYYLSINIPGFTIVFAIKERSVDTILQFDNYRYGGIVNLFFNYDNTSSADKCLLIILNITGIYKFYFEHLNKNKPTIKIQMLKYPNRTIKVMEYYNTHYYNLKSLKLSEHDKYEKIRELNMEYIQASLSKHYFLADTMLEGAQYMDLYDLKTNQLVNTFSRTNVCGSGLTYRPGFFTISNNDKLLAYKFKSGRRIKLYSLDCGLEVASIKIDETDEISYDYYFLNFFSNDERLLVYRFNTMEWSIWDIFGSLQKSIKLEKRPDFDLNLQVEDAHTEKLKHSNSFIITIKNNELVIYDDLLSDKFLKLLKNVDKLGFKDLPLEETWKKSDDKYEYFIRDLDNNKSELNKNYHVIEPWRGRTGHSGGPRYSVYLDEKKEVMLLIGRCTIQVWRDKDEKRTLEFISVSNDEITESEVKEIKYGIRKFKLSIQRKDSDKSIYQIEMGDNEDDDIIKAVSAACNALIYLNKWSQTPNYGYAVSFVQLEEIVRQTRNIIVRFQSYPIVWRLLDFRFNLMTTLVIAGDYSLVKYILFDEKKEGSDDEPENNILKNLNITASKMQIKEPSSDRNSLLHEKSLHMPKLTSWTGELEYALLEALKVDDPVFLGFLLEYYSNKEIGWMVTVTDVIPRLYSEENKKNAEVYKSYAQLLFYKSCFCKKELDIPSFEFIEIPPSMDNSLKVFIPITQLIPQDLDLKVKLLSQYMIPKVLMVPLVDFTAVKVNKKDMKEYKFINFLKTIFYPGEYAQKEDYYSPFLKLIEKLESNDPFFCNPSMEATMNVMCQSSTTYEFSNGSDTYTMTEDEPDNSFSNLFSSIVAAYNWDSIPLDAWDFWPLIIISVIGSFVFDVRLLLRVIQANESVIEINYVNATEIQDINYCMVESGLKDPINFYPLFDQYILVTYTHATNTSDNTTYTDHGMVLDWNGNVISKLDFGQSYLYQGTIWIPNKFLVNNITPKKGFLRLSETTVNGVDSFKWAQYGYNGNGSFSLLQNDTTESIGFQVNLFATLDGGYAIVYVNMINRPIASNTTLVPQFTADVGICAIMLGYNQSETPQQIILFNKLTPNLTFTSIYCSIDFANIGHSCIVQVAQTQTQTIQNIITTVITATMTPTAAAPTVVSVTTTISAPPTAITSSESFYVKIRFLSTGSVLSLDLIFPPNKGPLTNVRTLPLEDDKLFNYAFPLDPLTSNFDGAFDILQSNTLLVALNETTTSWQILSIVLPPLSQYNNSGYGNLHVNATYPSINAKDLPLNTNKINIMFNDRVSLSDANLTIYQTINQISILRQVINSRTCTKCELTLRIPAEEGRLGSNKYYQLSATGILISLYIRETKDDKKLTAADIKDNLHQLIINKTVTDQETNEESDLEIKEEPNLIFTATWLNDIRTIKGESGKYTQSRTISCVDLIKLHCSQTSISDHIEK